MSTNLLKTAIIGSDNVGKTALCNTIVDRTVNKNYNPTMGVDLMVKYIRQYNETLKLLLWDIAGNERFMGILDSYVISTPVLIFCYSAECLQSFHEMTRRHENYLYNGHTEGKHIIFVVTKIDSNNIKPDYADWGSEYAKKYKRPFIKTSAYTKEGIPELINECLKYLKTPDEPINLNCKIKDPRINCCLF